MRTRDTGWTDQRIDLVVAFILRFGVLLASFIVLVGGIGYLIRYGGEAPTYAIFHGEPSNLRGLAGILSASRSFERRGLIQLGLLVLIATPVARVAFSVVAFFLEKDRVYVGITLIVLLILTYGLAFSH